MSLAKLIIGGNREIRKKKALEFAEKVSSTFDTNMFDAEESGGIETIRALNQKLTRRPFDSLQQSIILLEAQDLTIEAQNAFLKNLEEGSSSAQIILTAATSESLLSTVTSRCQKIDLPAECGTITDSDWRFFIKFLQSGTYNQYISTDKLDFENWILIWRTILLACLTLEKTPFFFTANPNDILRYLRLANKLYSLQKQRVASRLLKTILILQIPRIDIKTTNQSE